MWGGFLAAILGLAAWVFPHWRKRAGERGGASWRALRDGVRQGPAQAEALYARVKQGHGPQGAAQRAVRGAVNAPQAWPVSPRHVGLALLLLAVPVAAVLVWSHWRPRVLDGYDDTLSLSDARVAQLLQGEQLVPPPPLPPAVFMTAEVQQARPLLASADRRWEQLDAGFVQRLLRVFDVMKREHGYEMVLLEGFRSPQRQALLAAQGSQVTMAGPGQSYHQYGLAADCAFFKDGRLHISEKEPWAQRGYQLFGQVAEQLGLTWGGRWQMMDLGHVEWRRVSIEQAQREAASAGTTAH